MAQAILTGWEEAPDTNPVWRDRIYDPPGGATERIRRIPREILESGFAVTWPAIEAQIKDPVEVSKFRHVLQNVYFSAYLREPGYDLRVVTSLPYASHSFLGSPSDLAYDYDALRAALSFDGIWDVLSNLSAPSTLYLRRRTGYLRFRETFDTIASEALGVHEIRKIFVAATEARKPKARLLAAVSRASRNVIPLHGVAATEADIDEIAERLGAVADAALDIRENLIEGKPHARVEKRKKVGRSIPYEVAIFVALEMERKMLVDRWQLQASGLEPVWRGELGRSRVAVFGRDEMGRVPAAVATMRFLSELNKKPDMLIVAGIAGGFAREQVFLGDVLVPTSVVDLASRRIHSDIRTVPQFRPREFEVDDRVLNYLKAGFKQQEWETSVIRDAEWPESRRPGIRFGPVVSLDEVVASTDWVDKLCDYWPKLLGIEMEAGGVCAATKTFGFAPAVLRGVSDLADPSKSDMEWRRRAMKTLAHLIENLDFDVILS
ncbi:MAG: hypothetical protein JO097_19665 [Acidobacteriaceae bacterium]|nr:hypothetical protein [Acidobacteriaceae bacterium]MBV9296876.1 hypothetical protein [Acidobacteriaceae bacterium]MBV9766954.1 hypothetical protein [Acidobacteriaceae bacterium]